MLFYWTLEKKTHARTFLRANAQCPYTCRERNRNTPLWCISVKITAEKDENSLRDESNVVFFMQKQRVISLSVNVTLFGGKFITISLPSLIWQTSTSGHITVSRWGPDRSEQCPTSLAPGLIAVTRYWPVEDKTKQVGVLLAGHGTV